MSRSDTAVRLSIDNDPPLDVVFNLKRTANGLERVRQLLNNNAIHISSGYRSPALERVLCDSAYRAWCKRREMEVNPQSWSDYLLTKSHVKGQAVDFTSNYGTPAQIVKLLVHHGNGLEYDQCILEFPNSVNGGWVHISFSDNNRQQALVIDQLGTRSYA
jgi:hypothetical protein